MPVDERFYTYKGPQSLRTLLDVCGLDTSVSADPEISSIAAAASAREGDICFFEGDPKRSMNVSASATACFVHDNAAGALPDGVTPVVVSHPRFAQKRASEELFELKSWTESGEAASIHETAKVAPSAVIGAGASIGEEAEIAPGVVIGPGVQIGARTKIGPNVSIRCALIGNDVTILAGASIGEAGFGVTAGPEGAEGVPQWGRVSIQDLGTIGANTCIDRGKLADTRIGSGTKIDNLCQIGHNGDIGNNVIICGCCAIAGSVTIHDGVTIAGNVRLSDGVTVGAGATIGAGSGVINDVPAGETWLGGPAQPAREAAANYAQLRTLAKDMRQIRKRLRDA